MDTPTRSPKEFAVVAVIGFALFFGWSLYDSGLYQALFRPVTVSAASSSSTATLSVTVGSNITLTIDGTCDNGKTNCDSNASASFGTLTALTSNNANTRVKFVANDTATLAIGRKRAISNVTLASDASPASINISDLGSGTGTANAGPKAFTGCSSPVTAAWSEGVSTGLGYTVWATSTGGDKSAGCWGTGTDFTGGSAAGNLYAALQASSSASTALTTSVTGTYYASIGYRLAVTATQAATTYTGNVIYTGTTTP
ncbi:MAG: hypothetical protein IT406_03490 [Candidatus Yanofskybacteria bacterium]|nr:hypothetical protein [Candidatus Yanofskybacteria bacterium]